MSGAFQLVAKHTAPGCCADKPVTAPDNSHSHQAAVQTNQLLLHTTHIPTRLLCRQTNCCSTQLTFLQAAVQTNQLLLHTTHIPTRLLCKPAAAPHNSHSHKLLCRQTSHCSTQLTFPSRLACHTLQTTRQTQGCSCPQVKSLNGWGPGAALGSNRVQLQCPLGAKRKILHLYGKLMACP